MTGNSEYLYLKSFSVNAEFESEPIMVNKSVTWICQIVSQEL